MRPTANTNLRPEPEFTFLDVATQLSKVTVRNLAYSTLYGTAASGIMSASALIGEQLFADTRYAATLPTWKQLTMAMLPGAVSLVFVARALKATVEILAEVNRITPPPEPVLTPQPVPTRATIHFLTANGISSVPQDAIPDEVRQQLGEIFRRPETHAHEE